METQLAFLYCTFIGNLFQPILYFLACLNWSAESYLPTKYSLNSKLSIRGICSESTFIFF